MSGGPRDFNFVTPEQLFEIEKKSGNPEHTLSELKNMAKDRRNCIVCGQPVWKYGSCELCFTCTTGEADASDDYELEEG